MSRWSIETRKDLLGKLILFPLSPLLATIYSFKRANTKSSYTIFFLTSILFGLAFIAELPGLSESYIDSQSYRRRFEEYLTTTDNEFLYKLDLYLTFDSNIKDFYFDTIAFYVSRVSDNYHIMFMVFAIVFSYFSLRSFRFLTSETAFDSSVISYILAYFFLYNQIFNINGVRFWTAAWIAVYCIFNIIKKDNKKYYFLMFITPFVHGSYWVLIFVFVIANVSKRFNRFWIFMFLLSIIFSNFSLILVQVLTGTFESYLPKFLIRLTEVYTSQEVLTEKSEWSGYGWIYVSFDYLKQAYLTGIFFILFIQRKTILNNIASRQLFLFLVVYLTCFNFLLAIPSLGARFLVLAFPMIAYIWLVCFKEKKLYEWYIFLLPVAFFWDIITKLLLYSRVLDLHSLLLSPIFLFYSNIINY